MKQIVAMGGGGFSMEPDNLRLDRYLLGLISKPRPKLCFVPTASGDSETLIADFYRSFATLPCEPAHLDLFRRSVEDLRTFILGQDIVYVGGGNTLNMLAVWQAHGLDSILSEAWNHGIVLGGLSAGSHCWFEQGLTDSIPGTLTPIRGLGFLAGSNCVHYDGESDRRPSYLAGIGAGTIKEGYAADDGVALHFIDDKLTKVVSSRLDARAYEVRRGPSGAVETVITPEIEG